MIEYLQFTKIDFFLAIRNLRTQKSHYKPTLSAFLSCFSVFISVMLLIIVNSIMRGFETEFISKIIGTNPHIVVFGKLDNSEIQTIQNTTGVKNVLNSVTTQALAVSNQNNGINGVVVKGVDIEKYLNISNIRCLYCDFNLLKHDFSVLIGNIFAQNMNLKIGDSFNIMIPSVRTSIFGNIPKEKTLTVGGIVNFGLSQMDSSFVILNIKGANLLAKDMEDAFATDVFIKNPNDANDISFEIFNKINKNSSTWIESNAEIMNAIKIERVVLFALMSIFVIISMFVILATITMMVYEKKKEIAILMAMGMNSIQIWRIFFISGIIIAAVGTIFGSVFGITIAKNIDRIKDIIENFTHIKLFDATVYFLSNLPSIVSYYDVFLICGLCFTFGTIITIIPASKAAKTNPSLSLRYF